MSLQRSVALLFLLAVMPSMMPGQGKGTPDRVSREEAAARVTGSPQYAVLNINNITAWMAFNGISNHSPSGDDGAYFPRSTGSVIYQDGLVWAGKAYTDASLTQQAPRQLIRAGGTQFSTSNGVRAGAIVGSGPTAVGEDPSSPSVRIWRIRRDYAGMSDSELMRDAASVNEIDESAVTPSQIAMVRAQYELDWTEWPVAKGAPFIDRNRNGVYDPPPALTNFFTADSLVAGGYDEPGVAGHDDRLPADQVIWTVTNDLTVATSQSFAGSEPLGLEIQKTMWAYRRTNALGNVYFTRHTIINKGGVDTSTALGDQRGWLWIDSLYVGQWSDPDVGNAGDDLVGCDVSRSLGYAYNGHATDTEFQSFGLAPPSVGYDLLGGPLVPSPGDSAIVNFKRRLGVRALPMKAFTARSAGDAVDSGSDLYLGPTGQLWKELRGFRPLGTLLTVDEPYATGPFPTSKFIFPDDPLNGSGNIDGLGTTWSRSPGDRRLMVSSGPVRLAPGDTQEVYIGVVAGIGADRLSSIMALRVNDRTLQTVFDRGLSVPTAPAPPVVTAAELDGAVVLQWGTDFNAVRATEERVIADTYRFEGYVVYQLPEPSNRLSDALRIATFDVKNGRTTILEERADQTTGVPTMVLVQKGTDSGVERALKITGTYDEEPSPYRDTPTRPLRNGQTYHYAVTAYNVTTEAGGLPVSLESDPVYVTVKPRNPFGERMMTAFGDTLAVVRASGSSDVRIVPTIVDPLAGRGDTFRISFRRIGGEARYTLANRSRATTIVEDRTIGSADEAYPVVDGAQVRITMDGLTGLKPNAWTFDLGTRMMTWVNGERLNMEEFNGSVGWNAPGYVIGALAARPVPSSALRKILVRFARHDTVSASSFNSASDDTASYAYRFLFNADQPSAQPAFATWIVAPGSGVRLQDYRVSMPLAVYDVDANPPQRLAVGYTENNASNGLVDGYYWPGYQAAMPGGDNNTSTTGPREWLVVMNAPYTGATPVAAWQEIGSDPAIPAMYLFTWNRRDPGPWHPPLEASFTPHRLPDSTDVFEFVVPAPASGRALQLADVSRIGVFPNPYYAESTISGSGYSASVRQLVTFNNLPPRATIRIFNVAGHLVRTLQKESPSQFFEWDLENENGWLVASGMYICHVELPDLGVSKVLKLAVIAAMPGLR